MHGELVTVLYEGEIFARDARGKLVVDSSLGDEGIANANERAPGDPRQHLFRISATDRNGSLSPLLKEALGASPPIPWASRDHHRAGRALAGDAAWRITDAERETLRRHVAATPYQDLAFNELRIDVHDYPPSDARCGQPRFEHARAVWAWPWHAQEGRVTAYDLRLLHRYLHHGGEPLPWQSWATRDHAWQICRRIEPEDEHRWKLLFPGAKPPDWTALARRIQGDACLTADFGGGVLDDDAPAAGSLLPAA